MGTKRFSKADVFKFVGLIAFLILMGVIVVLLWPYFGEMFKPGGIERILDEVRNAGPAGVFILLGLQFLQIVVAFIPGEVTQVAAGMLYGPWFGALIILVGCVVSSAFIFALVHKLGAPFVQSIVPVKYLDKFREFENTGKLNILVFILFLIPGLPKDTFTYLVPLTDMRMRNFILLSNIGRIPGVIVSTYAADGLADGRIVESIVLFAITAGIAILGIVFHEKLMDFFGKLTKSKHDQRNGEADRRETGARSKKRRYFDYARKNGEAEDLTDGKHVVEVQVAADRSNVGRPAQKQPVFERAGQEKPIAGPTTAGQSAKDRSKISRL